MPLGGGEGIANFLIPSFRESSSSVFLPQGKGFVRRGRKPDGPIRGEIDRETSISLLLGKQHHPARARGEEAYLDLRRAPLLRKRGESAIIA